MANIQSGASADILTVDPASKAARATLYDTAGNALIVKNGVSLPAGGVSGLVMAGINDGASRIARFDRYGNIRPGVEQLLFRDSSETGAVSGAPTTPNLNQWATSSSGFLVGAPVTSGNQLTATSVTTAGAYSIATSIRQFQKLAKQPLFYRRRGRVSQVANTVSEFGFGAPAVATATIQNSAHWRYNAVGQVIPVITYNNTEILGSDISTLLNSASYYTWEIIVDDDNVLFVCQDVSTGKSISEQTLNIAIASPKIWSVTRLPIFERVYNTATAPATAPVVFFSDIYVCSMDVVANKSWQLQAVSSGQGGAEVYPGAFAAANAQNANYANSTAPTSGALSNTAGSFTTLGGQFQFAAVAGAETDYALFAFTVPAGFTFFSSGIRIGLYNTGAAVATTPTLLQWSVANNSSAVSLATVGLTRTTIGTQSLPVGAVPGQNVTCIDMAFDTPLITHGGRVFQVILKMPVATATAAQVIRGTVVIRGFFE